ASRRRCAIYTRKSSEEGLEQEFNSLAAQREACEAYIRSQQIRRLVGLAFLSPQLVEAILQGRQPVALTATRLTELDLPLDWTEQHKLLAG
ncbi:MAG TPA: recombinase family protein, partial [Granulicella sp.]|nr:recombinase family protein [Granulicella sp.]